MPNFTEGDWEVINCNCSDDDGNKWLEYGIIAHIENSQVLMKYTAHDIKNKSDAHLMAQSKKMYEALKSIACRYCDDPDPYYQEQDIIAMQSIAKSIISEIDKE